jgi:hypothetical protein
VSARWSNIYIYIYIYICFYKQFFIVNKCEDDGDGEEQVRNDQL